MEGRQESPENSSRRGGVAARNSIQPDSDYPCPQMRKASSSSGESRRQSDSSNPETSVKKSSSRWADRPVPVLQVEFPEPWSIIARAASAGAENGNSEKNPNWSGWWDSNPRPIAPKATALPGCATPRRLNERARRLARVRVVLKRKNEVL